MSAIPCLTWVKRGVSSAHPHKIQLTDEELSKLAKGGNDSDGSEDDRPKVKHTKSEDIDTRYELDNYDSDEENDDEEDEEDEEDDEDSSDDDDEESDIPGKKVIKKLRITEGLSIGGVLLPNTNQDQYLNKDDNESDEEAEIQDDDNLLLVGKISGEMFDMETYIYNENTSSLYCHHDTMLGAFPLVMEWIGYDPGEQAPGNLLAVGSINPDIELWDLDVINTLEPAFLLHGAVKKKGKKKFKKSIKGHTDAVLALSWNSLQPNVLASGSADFTIGVWDIDEGEIVMSIKKHSEKVQSLQWHPFERETLLSGSCDSTVRLFDCRDFEASHKTWNVTGEVEKVCWNTDDPYYFLTATDSGYFYYMDVRTDKPVFSLKAHKRAISGLAMSSSLDGCVVTTSLDQRVKVWDIRGNEPSLVDTMKFKLGEITCMAPCPDSGFVYALGGETELRMFHLKTSLKVLNQWELEDVDGVAASKIQESEESESDSSDSDEDSSIDDDDGDYDDGDDDDDDGDDVDYDDETILHVNLASLKKSKKNTSEGKDFAETSHINEEEKINDSKPKKNKKKKIKDTKSNEIAQSHEKKSEISETNVSEKIKKKKKKSKKESIKSNVESSGHIKKKKKKQKKVKNL